MESMNKYYFTFGSNSLNHGKCQVIEASCELYARAKMFELHGRNFCTSYPEDIWIEMKNNSKRPYPLEKELPEIIVISNEEAEMLINNGIFERS